MTDKIVLTLNIDARNFEKRIPMYKNHMGSLEALEMIHIPVDYYMGTQTDNSTCYNTGKKIGQTIREYAPELEMFEIHYPFSCELMEREGSSLINTIEEIRGIQEYTENLEIVTINHHPVYLDPLGDNDVEGRRDLLLSQAVQTRRAQKLISAYMKKFPDMNLRPRLIAEANPIFSKTRFFGNADMTQICAEDFENMELDGILLDYSHVHSDVMAHSEDIEMRDSLPNIRLLRNQHFGTPVSCISLDNYFRVLREMNLEINWIHLGDEASAYSHNGFPLLPEPKKKGYINTEKCLRLLDENIPNGERVGATLEISTPPSYKPEGWEAFKKSYEFIIELMKEI